LILIKIYVILFIESEGKLSSWFVNGFIWILLDKTQPYKLGLFIVPAWKPIGKNYQLGKIFQLGK